MLLPIETPVYEQFRIYIYCDGIQSLFLYYNFRPKLYVNRSFRHTKYRPNCQENPEIVSSFILKV